MEFVGGVFMFVLFDGGVEIVGLSFGLLLFELVFVVLFVVVYECGVVVWGELEFFV